METILQKIEVLKNKITVAIDSFGFYSEFKYIKDILYNELNSYQYDSSDEMSLKKYYAWLQEFYEGRIEVINKSIADNDNSSVFDNSTKEQLDEIEKYKKEIESLLEYIKSNYSEFASSIIESYKNINKYYEEQYKSILDNGKKKLNIDLGIDKEPALSIYQDAYSLMRAYITKLDNFNSSCSNVKKFAENDTKIKDTFKRAYNSIDDSSIIEMINKMENNYKKTIELSIKNGFSLEGIESIQETVVNQCMKLEDLLSKELIKKDFHNQILNMTLNIEYDKLMEIINYVETNNIYKEELLNNLYALVEQEKYLLKKYNYEPKIYNALSEKLKVELEKKYISRLSEFKENETSEIIDKLKKYGYIKVSDKKYYDYYSKKSFKNEIEFDIEEPKYKIINYVYKSNYEYYYGDKWRFVLVISNRKDLPILSINSPIYKSDIVLSKRNTQGFEEHGDFIILRYGNDYIKRIFINLKTGKVTKPKPGMCEKVFDFIIGYDTKNKKYFVYDQNYKLLHTVDNYSDIDIDYKKKLFLITIGDSTDINIYDKDFNHTKTIKLPFDYIYTICANDGIMTLLCPNDEIVYYDYINMKVIDSFKCTSTYFPDLKYQFVYNDGLYSYIDKNGRKGYKDLEGNIRIEPRLGYAAPFMSNIAVVMKNGQKGIMDITGSFHPLQEVYDNLNKKKRELYNSEVVNPHKIDIGYNLDYLGDSFWDSSTEMAKLVQDFEENRYKLVFDKFLSNRNKGHLVSKDHFIINIDEPIMNIDFSSNLNEKVLSKRR